MATKLPFLLIVSLLSLLLTAATGHYWWRSKNNNERRMKALCETYKISEAQGLCLAFCFSKRCHLQGADLSTSCMRLKLQFARKTGGQDPPCLASNASHTPSETPSTLPSLQPSGSPSESPQSSPSSDPSSSPSSLPSLDPSSEPSETPSETPSSLPSLQPSGSPSESPQSSPSSDPSSSPSSLSVAPSGMPSSEPTGAPSSGSDRLERFCNDSWIPPYTIFERSGPSDVFDSTVYLNTTRSGIVTLAPVEDLISSVNCSETPPTVVIELVEGFLFPPGNVSECFPTDSLLIVRGDIFGACLLEPQTDFRASFEDAAAAKDGLLIIANAVSSGPTVILTGEVAPFMAQFEGFFINATQPDTTRRQLLEFPIPQKTITIPVGEGYIKFRIKSGSIFVNVRGFSLAYFTYSIIFLPLWDPDFDYFYFRAEFSCRVEIDLVEVRIKETELVDLSLEIIKKALWIGIPLGFEFSDIEVGLFVEVTGGAPIVANADLDLDGTYEYELPSNSVTLYARKGLQYTSNAASAVRTSDPTDGDSSENDNFSLEGLFGVDYGLKLLFSALSEDPIAELSQKAGAFVKGEYREAGFPPVTTTDPPFDFGPCDTKHLIQADLDLGTTELAAKVDFQFDPYWGDPIVFKDEKTILDESKEPFAVVCALKQTEAPSMTPSSDPSLAPYEPPSITPSVAPTIPPSVGPSPEPSAPSPEPSAPSPEPSAPSPEPNALHRLRHRKEPVP